MVQTRINSVPPPVARPPSGRFTCVASMTTCMKRTAISTSGFLYRTKKFSMTMQLRYGGPEEARVFFKSAPRLLLDRNLSQEFEVAEHLSRAQHHAGQRIVSD